MMKSKSFCQYLLFLFLPFYLNAQEELKPFENYRLPKESKKEFASKPQLTKLGNQFKIQFEVAEFCDVTIAIEDLNGKIARHLASGLLGSNAPQPFQKDSKKQIIIWDGKDDQGKYIDQLTNYRCRVSLGLKALYEKDLFHSPYRRISSIPLLSIGKEGLYVYEAQGRDQLKLFDRSGEYKKTIYPFPASQIKNVEGLDWRKTPSGKEVPWKQSIYHQTLLTSGDNACFTDKLGMTGAAAMGMAIKNEQIALAYESINRLTTKGNTGGLPLKGPDVHIKIKRGGYGGFNSGEQPIGPSSMAFSADGKTLYMTGYHWQQRHGADAGSLLAVMKIDYSSQGSPSVFAGAQKVNDYTGGKEELYLPTSVDTDSSGKVYVTDFLAHQLKIYHENGTLEKVISTPYPAKVQVHQKTGKIYVFSFGIMGVSNKILKDQKLDMRKLPQKLSIFTAYPECKVLSEEEFPLGPTEHAMIFGKGQVYQIALDSWAEEETFWIAGRKHIATLADFKANWLAASKVSDPNTWKIGIRKIVRKNKQWEDQLNFNQKLIAELPRFTPPKWNIQQLYFNPKNEKLYIGEAQSAPTIKAFDELIEVDPLTTEKKLVPLPFNPQDIAFDLNGLIYMRTMNVLARFDMNPWREVPFDYGSEKDAVGQDGGIGGKSSPVISGIMLPAANAVCYHQGGLHVNAMGDIIVACHNRSFNANNPEMLVTKEIKLTASYKPFEYPGRLESSTSTSLHVWDKFGKIKYQDVIKGCPQTDGISMDTDNNVYIMATPPRQLEKDYLFGIMSSTLLKFSNKKGTFLSSKGDIPIPLPKESQPKRKPDLRGLWVNDADWIFGGVGFGGFNAAQAGGGCACWFARFKLDYYARSIVPEPMQYSVSVLDKAGNLMLKIGQYGNVDSRGEKSLEPLGGDEVSLFHPCFTATQTDKRVFISDIGNERILSVKLFYETDEYLSLDKQTE